MLAPTEDLEVTPNERLVFKGKADQPESIEWKLKNVSKKKISFKIRSSNSDLIDTTPQIGFINPGETSVVIVKRNPFHPSPRKPIKQEKLCVMHIYVPAADITKDATRIWANVGLVQPTAIEARNQRIKVVIMANENASELSDRED